MIEQQEYGVGDIFKIYDRGLQKDKFVVLSRFVFKAEHFVLLSFSTFERWTDRELTFKNEFEKTRLSKEEVLYLSGDEEMTYMGNINTIRWDLFDFINEKLSPVD
ncbi:hypothetical protein Dacet_0906 [Denitrovibrio acetiphilus DSM 12809]|uniref:Uncharacterized protein n=1 Tax=Denitrovibrio acetiphilus (strain DSM 12809 / NBRC 114555 / N2460) TaxID=522772 RepID=D4H639_DENA2|nr:hypothetical protein [Denitrovibrio acetiphilus]ADD67685.1 hypothetical protein Dacet_0906 [Denitrovibrio acetiphilus DSM 12809]